MRPSRHLLLVATPPAHRPPTLLEAPAMPYAYLAGHDAGRAGAADAENPYALCLPTDNEALAALWDQGLRLGRRAALGVALQFPPLTHVPSVASGRPALIPTRRARQRPEYAQTRSS